MKKRIKIIALVLVSFLFTIIDVKADAPVYGYIGMENDGYYHYNGIKNNEYVIEPGDEIEVTYIVNNWDYDDENEYFLNKNYITIYYDDAFEVDNNGFGYTKIIDGIVPEFSSFEVNKSGYVFNVENYLLKKGLNPILKFKVNVRDDAKDGVYRIYLMNDINADIICDDGNGNSREFYNYDAVLTFRIGEKNDEFNVLSSAIENNTYIIGNYMFTRNANEKYEGVLTTKHIMLASKSIESSNTDDMIIYYKNARGNWVDAIDNSEIEAPDSFEVVYKDLLNYDVKDVSVITPTIVGPLNEDGSLENVSPIFENGLNYYTFKLDNINDYVEDNTCYEILIQYGDDPIMYVAKQNIDENIRIGVEPGHDFKVYARVQVIDDFGTLYHSDYSEPIEVEAKLPTPILSISEAMLGGYENSEDIQKGYEIAGNFDEDKNAMYHDLVIDFDKYDELDEDFTLGWKLYEKVGSNYIEAEYEELEENTYAETIMHAPLSVWVPYGTSKTFVAAVYMEEDGERIYSEYSNEIVLDYRTLDAPILEGGADSSRGIGILSYNNEDNSFHCDEAINFENYIIKNDSTVVAVRALGWEIYEVNGKTYTKVADGDDNQIDIEEVFELIIPNGEKKVFVARVFAKDEHGQRFYSGYSEPLTFDYTTPETPTLQTSSGGQTAWVGLEDNTFVYDLGVDLNKYEAYRYSEFDDPNYIIAGWELCDAQTHAVVEDGDKEAGDPVTVFIPNGEKRSYVARVYGLNSEGNKFYSDYSKSITIDHTKPIAPTLGASSGNEDFAFLVITSEGLYMGSNYSDSIDGWTLYEKINGNYVFVSDHEVRGGEGFSVEVGTSRTFIAKVYKLVDDQRCYSDYSNEFTIEFLKPLVPDLSIASREETSVDLGIYMSGIYGWNELINDEEWETFWKGEWEEKLATIDGWELYEVVGNTKTKIDDALPKEDITVDISDTTKRYVARVFVTNSKGDTLYSDYSNIIELP